MRIIWRFILVYFVLLSIFLTALTLSCTIPSFLLKTNIAKSLKTLKNEGLYPSFGLPFRQIVLDNFTDSLMLNTAYSVDSKNSFRSAFANYRYEGKVDSVNQISNLEKLYLNKKEGIKKVGYERYWHGYLIYLRPLLIFFPYSQIRIIIFLLLYISFIVYTYLSWKKLGKRVTIIFILGLIAVDFFFLSHSLQFFPVFLIGLIGAIFILLLPEPEKNQFLLFFIIGGLTSFFDLLTAPLITLGIPLVTTTRLGKKNGLLTVLNCCLFWLIGYVALWFSKWILAQFFIPSALPEAFSIIKDRTFHKADANFSYFNTLKLNFFQLVGYNRINKIIILFLFIIFSIFFLTHFKLRKEKLNNIGVWILIGIIPYLWYLTAANHSYIHVWYTYRNQFMTVVSLFLILENFINWPKISAPKRHKN